MEDRSFLENSQKNGGSGRGLGRGEVGLVGWGQGGRERRIEIFVKIQKKNWGGVGSGGVGLGGGSGWKGGGSGWM